MTRNILWIEDPPEASAEAWAEVWTRINEFMPAEAEDEANEKDQLLSFVLGDALRRCAVEAEDRETGILDERVQADIESTRAWIEGAGDNP